MRPGAGFTLLEVLVAMALLAVLGVALAGLVRTTASVSADVRGRFEEAARLQTARSLLAERVARALPVPSSDTASEPAFEGGPGHLRFVAAEPPYARFTGLVAWEFALEEVPGGTLVKVRTAPAAEGEPLRSLAAADWRPLARVAGRLRFGFLAPAGEAEEEDGPWMTRWERRADLPRAVGLTGREGRGWPPLVVPLRIPELAGCAGTGAGAPACPS